MSRPSVDETMPAVAEALSRRASCAKRRVGCVLTDAEGRIVGSGYNGRPRGMDHCDEKACAGPCEGVHAETNALLRGNPAAVRTCYVTTAPCWHCVKQLAGTGCSVIVHSDWSTWETGSDDYWKSLGRAVKFEPGAKP